MRLEEQGREVKKTGYLRGTRMWAVRNRIIAGFLGSAILFDIFWIMYSRRNKDAITAKQEKYREAGWKEEINLAARIKALEERKQHLQDVNKKA